MFHDLLTEAWLKSLTPQERERLAKMTFPQFLRALLIVCGIVGASGIACVLILRGIERLIN